MHSHLTRHVFRRLLQDDILLQYQHVRRLRKPCFAVRHDCSAFPRVQKRTLFGIGQERKRPGLGFEPGMPEMRELNKRIQLVIRHPPADKLAGAFNAFTANKKFTKLPVEDMHATHMLQTLIDLESRASENKDGKPWLSYDNLNNALTVMVSATRVPQWTEVHNKLARALYGAMQERRKSGYDISSGPLGADPSNSEVNNFVTVLCATGDTVAARNILKDHPHASGQQLAGAWPRILQGFVAEKNEAELLATIELMRQYQLPFSPLAHQIMTLYYAQRDDIERTKEWHRSSIFIPKHEEATSKKGTAIPMEPKGKEQVFRQLLEFCIRNKEMEWGKTALVSNLADDPEKLTWDVIFQAAAATGRGVDEIDRMMGVMARRNQTPDVSTINGLIEFAISCKDAYTAERYISLAEKWNIPPNAQTYILQIEYRLMAGDYDGAKAAYVNLRRTPLEEKFQDFAIMNKMIQVLATIPNTDNTVIMGLVADMPKNKAYHSATVSTLAMYHLQRDEYFEVVDLLSQHTHYLPTSERRKMLDLMVAFALEPANDTGRTWDTYMIFHQVFDAETTRTIRTDIMSLLFTRGRPDLATHVFTTMSQHPSPAMHPDLTTYVAAFQGIAHTADEDALEIIHNMLKLDTAVDPCIRLLTALMLAHSACGNSGRSMSYWTEISTSAEGPSYATLHALFRTCEASANYAQRAEQVWQRLQKLDVEIGADLAASYLGALAGNALFAKAKRFVLGLEEEVGVVVDELIIGSFFNATIGVIKQEEVEGWIKEHFPSIWATLEAKGIEEDEGGVRRFTGIDRTVRV